MDKRKEWCAAISLLSLGILAATPTYTYTY
jgi:hypothetical protein